VAEGIDHLIINSPFEEPGEHWAYVHEAKKFQRVEGRRPAGYVVATPGLDSFQDPGTFIELPLVNQIRPRVAAWRAAGYPGVTGITKRLLEHWQDPETFETRRFFFCQLEAIETLIWLTEAPAADRQGVEIEGDGGAFSRLCAKMATGSGKTIVMAMSVAWHVLNKVANPQDRRFAKSVLVVAPGLTVRNRLSVLKPEDPDNYYDQFDVVPAALREKLRQGKVRVVNWHKLDWQSSAQLAKKRSVDKRGPKSDEAYVREVLGELAGARNLLVLNDEAHHAWRVPSGESVKVSQAEREEATKWVGGLDRIHRARGILTSYDFSATPFTPTGRRAAEESLFSWIVSDFGLSDAIESGLVKTPRVVVRSWGELDAKTYRPKLFHIYPHVAEDLNRRAEPHENLPDLVTTAYYLLGRDWEETFQRWQREGAPTPPVMITVANRTETAARIKFAFDRGRIDIPGLCDPSTTLHIDSRVLEKAEAQDEPASPEEVPADGDAEEIATKKLTKDELAELLRETVDTVGQPGRPGEQVRNVISVGMLSEGWDAKTVTHILGLRAFTSQLLCEQVVGRGLRRTSYEQGEDGLFRPEYVNIFGVPFTFLPHEGGDATPAPPEKPKFRVEPDPDKRQFEISWPNVVRIDQVYGQKLSLDPKDVPLLKLDAYETPTLVELAPTVEGKPDVSKIATIDLEALGRRYRLQALAFRIAAEEYDRIAPGWEGGREALLGQLVGIVQRFLEARRVHIEPPIFDQDPLRRRVLLALNMNRIVQHLFDRIRPENAVERRLVLERERPLRSTGDMPAWYTAKPCEHTKRSHINLCVYDSTWEAAEAFILDHDDNVAAWVKNEHLGFEVVYIWQGGVHKYRPDFLIQLRHGVKLVLEVKGNDTQRDRTKRSYLAEWVEAVNEHAGFGRWAWDVSFRTSDLAEKLRKRNHPVLGRT
jgi:type III restriction enzyme